MKRILLLGILLITFYNQVIAQKVISGKSNSTHIVLKPEYKRGMPPILYVDLSYEDENNNGILEPNEHSVLSLNITNKGKGPAQGLTVKVNDNVYDPEFKIKDGQKIPFLYPGQSVEIKIPITAGLNVKTNEHKLKIEVTEFFGYDMDPAYLVLNTMKYRNPELVFSGFEIIDTGPGTAPIITDGQLQPGELVKVKVYVQNIGQNVSENTKYLVYSKDNNIYLQGGEGVLGNIDVGEVKEFWITISPNKRISTQGQMPLFLTLSNKYGRGGMSEFNLPVELNQKPPETEIVKVTPYIEKLRNQVARFEYTSNRITTNIGNIIDINDKNLEIVGATREQMLGKNLASFASEAKEDPVAYKKFWEDLKLGKSRTRVFKEISKGKEIWVSETYTPILDNSGKPIKVLNIGTDITKSKKNEIETNDMLEHAFNKIKELEKTEKELREMIKKLSKK